eukprot:SAG22_NODE_7764_length_710_cov_1.055646_2_plen_91_part_01
MHAAVSNQALVLAIASSKVVGGPQLHAYADTRACTHLRSRLDRRHEQRLVHCVRPKRQPERPLHVPPPGQQQQPQHQQLPPLSVRFGAAGT